MIIGIDIGGTNIEAGLVNLKTFEIVEKTKQKSTFDQPLLNRALSDDEKLRYAKEAITNIGEVISGLYNLSKKRTRKVGIGIPGIISPKGEILTGVIFGSFPLKKAVKNHMREKYGFDFDINVENDANCGAYAHGEGQTLMIGTNLGSALNVNGGLIGRNTQLQSKWSDYCIFDEAGYAIRLDKKTTQRFFKGYMSKKEFNRHFDRLAEENKDSPVLVRLEQLLGGAAIQRMFDFFYKRKDFSPDAKILHKLAHIWEIEGRLLGYAIARLQNEAREKGYNVRDFHIGGGVASALEHMISSAEDSAEHYGAKNFEIKLSPYHNPNIIGAAIAF